MSGDNVMVVNEPLLELLRRRRVFHAQWNGDRWRPGQFVRAPRACAIEPYAQILEGAIVPAAMGAFSYSHSELYVALSIGRYCSIARDVRWMGTNHPTTWATTSPFSYTDAHPGARAFRADNPHIAPLRSFEEVTPRIEVGNDVWIGEGAKIARGVRIGDGAIIGAGALVLKDVAPYAIVGGSPARVIRSRLPEPLIERFLALAWWRFGPDVLQPLALDQPQRFAEELEALISTGDARPLALRPLGVEQMVEAVKTGKVPD